MMGGRSPDANRRGRGTPRGRRMMGGRSPEGNPRGRGTPRGRGWGSIGKSPISSEDGAFVFPNVSRSSKSAHFVASQLGQTSPDSVTPQPGQSSSEKVIGSGSVRVSEDDGEVHLFDICRTETVGLVTSKKSLLEKNPEKNKEQERLHNGPQTSPDSVTPQPGRSSSEKVIGSGSVRGFEGDGEVHPFDICRTDTVGLVILKKSLLEKNREKKKKQERLQNGPQFAYLRSGMILLKNYIDHHNQVKIIQICRDLGIGVGGFYRPGYRDGGKLHLQMMCLGKSWDPKLRSYGEKRPTDGAKPPKIPELFTTLVDGAIQASRDYLRQNHEEINVEDEIPRMSPDICIVNFYGNNGRLGLHQDRDESPESLHKGLPVISFSFGDEAEFLYGEERDEDHAEKVVLESGDVLIFGGKSRHIFHGVSSVHADTAPTELIGDSKLRPGRLNLTFRQY